MTEHLVIVVQEADVSICLLYSNNFLLIHTALAQSSARLDQKRGLNYKTDP